MIVLVIDSSPLFIERWQLMLSEMNCVRVVYGAVSYKDALKLFKELQPRVVLLDTNLPANRSIDLLAEMKANLSATTVIIVADRVDEHTQQQFSANGADFFFDKYYEFEKIPDILKAMAVKRRVVI